MKHKLLIALLVVGIAALSIVSAVSAAVVLTTSVSGEITVGGQYDLWALDLIAGEEIVSTLVCDFDGVGRPLDPVLRVYFPGSDPDDPNGYDVFNDDGFGLDDDPNGVDCDAFDSSRAFFTAPVDGTYIFRAQGFGSSTGPYTLTITIYTDVRAEINPLTADGRINPQATAPIVLYCEDGATVFYSVTGTYQGSVENGGSATFGAAVISPLADGRMQLAAGMQDGKIYLFIWDGCDSGSSEAYTISDDGIPTLFDTGSY